MVRHIANQPVGPHERSITKFEIAIIATADSAWRVTHISPHHKPSSQVVGYHVTRISISSLVNEIIRRWPSRGSFTGPIADQNQFGSNHTHSQLSKNWNFLSESLAPIEARHSTRSGRVALIPHDNHVLFAALLNYERPRLKRRRRGHPQRKNPMVVIEVPARARELNHIRRITTHVLVPRAVIGLGHRGFRCHGTARDATYVTPSMVTSYDS